MAEHVKYKRKHPSSMTCQEARRLMVLKAIDEINMRRLAEHLDICEDCYKISGVSPALQHKEETKDIPE